MVVRKISPEAKCASAEVRSRRGTVLRPVRRQDHHLREVGRGFGHHRGLWLPGCHPCDCGPIRALFLGGFLGARAPPLGLAGPLGIAPRFGFELDLPYLLVRRMGPKPWLPCLRHGSVHVRSDGAGPKSVPLLLEQPVPHEIKDLGDRQCEGDRCDPHGPLVVPEALAVEPHQIVSFLLLREMNLEGVGKRHHLI